jgi:hypothetical protein
MSSLHEKNSIFQQLEKVFDLMVTFEFSENLKSILRMYGKDLTEDDIGQIVHAQPYNDSLIPQKFTKILV